MDQCKNCIVKGDTTKCVVTKCSIHDTWFASDLTRQLAEARGEIEAIKEATDKRIDEWNEMVDELSAEQFENTELKKRLSEQIEDSGRIHDEKMKFWHDADNLKRQLAAEQKSVNELSLHSQDLAHELSELENAAILTYQQYQIKIDALEKESESLRANCDAQQETIEHLTRQLEAALKQLSEAREELAASKSYGKTLFERCRAFREKDAREADAKLFEVRDALFHEGIGHNKAIEELAEARAEIADAQDTENRLGIKLAECVSENERLEAEIVRLRKALELGLGPDDLKNDIVYPDGR